VLFDYMDIVDDVHQNRVPGRVVTHYYTFISPMVLQMMAPFAALVGTLATFGVLARRNEIVAMLAGGISLYRVAAPVVVLAALGSGLLFGVGEYVIPHTNRVAQTDRDRIKGKPPQSSIRHRDRWIMGSEGRIYYYQYLSQATVAKTASGRSEPESLHGLSMFEVDPARWELRERLQADVARWTGFTYELERGWRRTIGEAAGFRAFTETRTREIDPPAYFRREARDADSLPLLELRAHIAFMRARGGDVVPLEVQLHKKLALPLTTLVMVLLGIRFAFTVGRRGALYGIGVSVAIAIAFLVTVHLFEAMGNHGVLPPFLAAWAPTLLFGMAGLYLTSTLET
jgi:LPS export ABC transporter permease LptG